jgi:small conductance mechanosensitive channel
MLHSLNRVKKFLNIFFTSDGSDLNLIEKLVKIAVILAVIKLVIKILNGVVDKAFEKREKLKFGIDDKKSKTLAGVLKNLFKYVIYFIGIVSILDLFGIETNSILATAGIGGLAVGFGAQSLVKDVISGFLILFEDQYSVGDYVKIGEWEGTVEEMGLRMTKIRGSSGDLYIIPNGSIQFVTNKSKGPMSALVKINIAYEENIERVTEILENVCIKLKSEDKSILEGPTVLGITDMGKDNIEITVTAKTNPMEQWKVERELRKNIKEAFEKEKIAVSYPKKIIVEDSHQGGEQNLM